MRRTLRTSPGSVKIPRYWRGGSSPQGYIASRIYRQHDPMDYSVEDFLLGFLTCALLSVAALSLYVKHKKREAERQRQIMAVEILRNLNVSKLRKLLGDVSCLTPSLSV